MDQNKISVEVNLSTEDVWRFQKDVYYGNITSRSSIGITVVCLLIAIASISLKPPFGVIPAVTGILLFLPALLFVMLPLILKRIVIKSFQTNKLMQKTQMYHIGPAGIDITSESSNVFTRWDELYKANESKTGFVFFISKQQAYVIPKRCFSNDEEQMKRVREYLGKAPIPKEKKPFVKRFGMGLLVYIVLFFIIVAILNLNS